MEKDGWAIEYGEQPSRRTIPFGLTFGTSGIRRRMCLGLALEGSQAPCQARGDGGFSVAIW